MYKYENLKEFLELNKKSIAFQELNTYLANRSSACACVLNSNNITIRTLAWNRFDSENLSARYLTFTIGISAEVSIIKDSSTQLHYYNIEMRGNLRKQMNDLTVISINEVPESLLQKESVFSLFGLPTNITVDTLEETAERFYSAYCPEELIDNTRRYSLPVVKIKNRIGCKMWYADLPNGCLGRIYLDPSVADIYDTTTSPFPVRYPNEPIPFGSLLLNYEYYKIGDRTDDIVVSAHELIHWHFHQPFMEITGLLDNNRAPMNCSMEPLLPDDSMSAAEKAYWYAEWQANELSVRVAMPKHLVEEAIAEYEQCNRNGHRDGNYYQNMIDKLALDFNVPAEIMKKRFRQLGYDYADGTFVEEYAGEKYNFAFAHGSLQQNETFVIDRFNYKKLVNKNKQFAELIDLGRYVYLGYVVCLLDPRYVDVIIDENSLFFQLTPYAREHTDECCIKFAINSVVNTGDKYIRCGQTYLSKKDKKPLENYEAIISDDLKESIDVLSKEDSCLMKRITYGDTLSYYLFEFNKDKPVQIKDENGYFTHRAIQIITEFAEEIGLSVTSIRNYLNNCQPPKLETAMRICFGLGLDESQIRDMIRKAGHNINVPLPENKVCRLIFKLSTDKAEIILDNWKACVKHFEEECT